MNADRIETWDTEQVLAYVHDVKPWKQLSDREKIEWCRRVKYVRDNVTTDGAKWTNEKLAGLFGLEVASLKSRFARSEAISKSGDHIQPRKEHQRASDARRYFADPAIVGERKAEIVTEALSDDYVAEQVADRISRDPALLKRLERAHKALREPTESKDIPLDEAWQKWLTRLNSILTEGARLAARTEAEQVDPGVIPQAALYAYQLITEKKLDAELRVLLETEGVH